MSETAREKAYLCEEHEGSWDVDCPACAIAELEGAITRLETPDPCSACTGTGKSVSRRSCICKGVGTAAAELQGFRGALYASSLREDTCEGLLRDWLLKIDLNLDSGYSS